MINSVVLVGRLCADPELKYTPSGVAVTKFRIAVDRKFKNAAGERETDFINCVAWRQKAEFVNNYITKGRLVAVEGHLQVRQWTTQEGQKRNEYEVVAEDVSPLERARDREAGEGGPATGASAGGRGPARRDDHNAPPPEEMPDFDVPDITDPFADQ